MWIGMFIETDKWCEFHGWVDTVWKLVHELIRQKTDPWTDEANHNQRKMFKRENRKEKRGQRWGGSGKLDKVGKASKENGMIGS